MSRMVGVARSAAVLGRWITFVGRSTRARNASGIGSLCWPGQPAVVWLDEVPDLLWPVDFQRVLPDVFDRPLEIPSRVQEHLPPRPRPNRMHDAAPARR